MTPAASTAKPTARLVMLTALALALSVLPTAAAQAEPVGEIGEVAVERLAGPGRVETAIAVSRDAFESAEEVVLARADVYADALAGAPLAAMRGAPLLLTSSDRLSDGVLEEIQRLGADHVVLLGGRVALSDAVQQGLADAQVTTERRFGANRFETAYSIADGLLATPAETTTPTVFLVEGDNADPARGWPDAVSAAPYAAFLQAPILLTLQDAMPGPTRRSIDELGASEIIVVGGTAAVSDEVVAEFESETVTVRRLSGADRYATSADVYDEAVTRGMDPSVRWLATGRNFPDALAAGPAVAALGQTLLLVDGQDLLASQEPAVRLLADRELLTRINLLGGEAAIGAQMFAQLENILPVELEEADFCLTVLHNNDGESRLVDAGEGLEDFGGIDRFATVLQNEREAAATGLADDNCGERGVLTVTSGDNFLAGPPFSASLEKGVPFYDSIALDYLEYDALALGNHDFDFTPDVTADFIEGFTEAGAVFVSANLDVSAEPELDALEDAGRIVPSTLVDAGDRQIGVIGLTTPSLRAISSPRDVEVDPDLVGAVAEQVESLETQGADVIVLISHLQDIDEELALVPELSGVDIVVAGGGDEVLAAPGELLVPGDEMNVFGSYPMFVESGDGVEVPVVTTAGDYKYVGRLVTRFVESGTALALAPRPSSVDPRSRPVRVAGGDLPDAVEGDAFMRENVVEPVLDYVADLEATVIGTSAVDLDGSRPNIRLMETNLGNLVADSQIAAVRDRADEFGLDPDGAYVAIQNGGGIRNSTVIPAGPITQLTTFDIAPFPNFVGAFPEVSAAELKLALENGYSQLPSDDGRFAQIGGMSVELDLSQPGQERASEEGPISVEGDRVRSVTLDDGTVIVSDGEPVAGAPTVTLVMSDFLARGGDNYPPPDEEFTTVGVAYQQALEDYIADELGGEITGAEYPGGGEGRITALG